MNISPCETTPCAHEIECTRERKRERGGGAPCRRLDDAPEGTVLHRLSTNIVTLSGFSVALSRLPRLLDLPCSILRVEYRRWGAISTMARVDREGFHFLEVSCDCWLCDWTSEEQCFTFLLDERREKKGKRKWSLHRCEWLLISGKVVRTICSSFSRYKIRSNIFELFNSTIIRSKLCFF